MTRLPFVFISGAYGDADPYLMIDARIHRAREHAVYLAAAGIPFFSPHLNSCHFEAIAPDVPVAFWHRQDDVFRDAAAAVLVITEGWRDSRGTVRDIQQANAHGQPIYFTTDLRRLLEDWPELAPSTPEITPDAIDEVAIAAPGCPTCGRKNGDHLYSCRLSPMYVEHAVPEVAADVFRDAAAQVTAGCTGKWEGGEVACDPFTPPEGLCRRCRAIAFDTAKIGEGFHAA